MGHLNISRRWPLHPRKETDIINESECSKKSAQQGRSSCDARSVLSVREHGKMARTPLAAFFNIPSMSIVHTLSVLITLGIFLFLPEVSHGQQPKKFEILSIGVRGGINLDPGGIPPGEKEDFQQFDVFAILGFPGSWEWPRGWEARYRWYASAGVLKAAGDRGFIATSGPGVTFTKWDWNLSLDFGTGAVFVGDETFGRQDFGGPVQILGNGGISYHFPGNISAGWRFQHFSDAAFYGSNNRGIDVHLLELSYRF